MKNNKKKVPDEVLQIIKDRVDSPYFSPTSKAALERERDRILEAISSYKKKKKFNLEHEKYINGLKDWYEELIKLVNRIQKEIREEKPDLVSVDHSCYKLERLIKFMCLKKTEKQMDNDSEMLCGYQSRGVVAECYFGSFSKEDCKKCKFNRLKEYNPEKLGF